MCFQYAVGSGARSYGKGGLWSALMVYTQKIVAADSPPMNREIPPPPADNKIGALVARWPTPPPPPAAITTGADGTITIPAASFSSKNKSAPVSVLKSFEAGEQLLSNGCTSSVGPPCFEPNSSFWSYDGVTSETAGSFYLTVNFTTYHMDQDLLVSVNGAKNVEVPVFYTIGWWNQSQPVEVTLAKGKNTLTFTRTSGRDVCYKDFFLSPKKPVVPPPPGNFTPAPAPPAAGAASYIEVPSSTTCTEQGIAQVSEKDCSHACLALGFKSTGARARPDPPGCFVMSTGQYKGNCNYNLNKSATCHPPCTLYGSEVRQLCVRK